MQQQRILNGTVMDVGWNDDRRWMEVKQKSIEQQNSKTIKWQNGKTAEQQNSLQL
jgi:hypothetical protein